ncbi:MAG: peptidylprolyl isomerase [Bacteroidales bacterium]|nr:peptidylprolyl isomerase [Bacteroidales bacterium]
MTKSNMIFNAVKLSKLLPLLVTFLIVFSSVHGQDNSKKILAEIGNEKITVEEFLQIYRKNNTQVADLDPKSLEEYLELYINFRLKVLEAEENGLHNEQSFKDELQGYRAQLAKPYLVDEEATESLVKESYERSLEDLRASHILIRMEKTASPRDTLLAYNRIMGLRERIMNGEDFSKIAFEFSEDQSARDRDAGGRLVRGNKGDLGYFTAFDMVYAFEAAAYELKKGEVSLPIRTDFGYHLIKLTDRKPAMGKVLAAHILLLYPPDAKKQDSVALEEKINMVYEKLQAGETFESLALAHSDDRSTADKGGELQWFGSNRMIPDFIYQISLLKEFGSYSAPFQTHFGWHIIKLLDQQKPGSFEDSYTELKDKVQKNERSVVIKQSLVKRIKKDYGFKESSKALEVFYTAVTDSIFEGTWKIPSKPKLNSELFSLGNKKYTQMDFAKYLAETQRKTTREDIRFYVNANYDKFVEEVLMDYEDAQLENKYPEFKALVREYRDGILLFELTDKKIWSMAVKDTAGLMAYHAGVEHNYMWGERADASIFTFTDADASMIEKAMQLAADEVPNDTILEAINNEQEVLKITRKLYQKGDSELIDSVYWTYGPKDPVEQDGKTLMVVIHNTLEPGTKQLNEVRGLVTADYQNHLEKEWIKELRAKYPIKVNYDLLSQIK